MAVSFIIPHKGREELLQKTIHSILDLEFDLDKIEIIVVTQNTVLQCLERYRNTISISIIFHPEHDTISALRNQGVEHASGDYLVFLDADIQLSRNWLNVMCSELEANPERVLVSAVQRCSSESGSLEHIRVLLNNASADSPVQFLDGRNLFLTRQTFETVGGFPDHLVTCEDYYFTNKVHQIGEVYFTSKTSYIHLGEDKNYAELFQKEIWRGQSNLQSLQGRRITLREMPSILTPLWQVCFFLAAVICVLIAKPVAAFFSLTICCLPLILYAARLNRLGKQQLTFIDALWFYSVYLSARAIGTSVGIFKTIRI